MCESAQQHTTCHGEVHPVWAGAAERGLIPCTARARPHASLASTLCVGRPSHGVSDGGHSHARRSRRRAVARRRASRQRRRGRRLRLRLLAARQGAAALDVLDQQRLVVPTAQRRRPLAATCASCWHVRNLRPPTHKRSKHRGALVLPASLLATRRPAPPQPRSVPGPDNAVSLRPPLSLALTCETRLEQHSHCMQAIRSVSVPLPTSQAERPPNSGVCSSLAPP